MSSETDRVARVREAVGAVTDPELRRTLADLDMLREVTEVADGGVRVAVALTIVGCPASDRIERDVRAAAASVVGEAPVEVALGVMSPEEREALTTRLRGGRRRGNPFTPDSLTRVIAVTSGKGGVGKSTLTANLAVALADRGRRVGVVDADVHGFSIPALLGLVDADGASVRPTRIDDLIVPPVAFDVKVVSIGMFLPEGAARSAVAWRGPMLHRTIQQFLTEVYFADLDVLLIDMPPGTGDIAISIGQLLPHADVLVVTTPQAAASDVAARSALVARQTGQNVLGVVENMTAMTLPDGTTFDLFGSGGGDRIARELSTDAETVEVIARVPLSPALRRGGDTGEPVVRLAPQDAASLAIQQVADRILRSGRSLSGRPLPVTPR
ncbi:Mrp/NBP35 family ATP-binding protein [Microbacterium sp. BG28]|uniref:Mrp/NBP35 family ATP-binding protein n=1 Tax=Microbacterium sp. BG28 TaxID=3097356 RepID=UPI002A5AEF5B|nr:Mrp/NBP35 family ATP-binding protein [Microbacterium sp. BG28]MDY0828838.1 Mrp/NBP35 family ATP-binding protein [Microbacterium sp. BG28]